MKLALATIIALAIPLTARAAPFSEITCYANHEETATLYGEGVANLCDVVNIFGFTLTDEVKNLKAQLDQANNAVTLMQEIAATTQDDLQTSKAQLLRAQRKLRRQCRK